MKRHPKDRGFGYKKAYNYEQSIKEQENLDPTPKEWEELKKNLPQFFKEAIQFAITMGIVLMFGAFVILQIIKLLHNIL